MIITHPRGKIVELLYTTFRSDDTLTQYIAREKNNFVAINLKRDCSNKTFKAQPFAVNAARYPPMANPQPIEESQAAYRYTLAFDLKGTTTYNLFGPFPGLKNVVKDEQDGVEAPAKRRVTGTFRDLGSGIIPKQIVEDANLTEEFIASEVLNELCSKIIQDDTTTRSAKPANRDKSLHQFAKDYTNLKTDVKLLHHDTLRHHNGVVATTPIGATPLLAITHLIARKPAPAKNVARLAIGGKNVPIAFAIYVCRKAIWQTSARRTAATGVLGLATSLEIAMKQQHPGVIAVAILISHGYAEKGRESKGSAEVASLTTP
ncbi:hypothetical protein NW768_005075 [Fusarium equiseti]|uniref:Uncharacterized protein n=1 Tax=Fusarium equiseti TaxID=61235 RepID=A0ABQ8RE81_FUSEQ|nr:hypothetical protein NW768_005075 [Fusarium equiseti]